MRHAMFRLVCLVPLFRVSLLRVSLLRVSLLRVSLLLVSLSGLVGCERLLHGHDHDEEHGHEHDDHGGHDDHDDHGAHGHAEDALRLITFSDELELCVEVPAPVRGHEAEFAAHLTWSKDWRPVASGRVTAIFSGGGSPEERFSVEAPTQAGIFRPVAVPKHAGERQVTMLLEQDGRTWTHDLGKVTVYEVEDDVVKPEEGDDAGLIGFTLEQQWVLGFRAARVAEHELRSGLEVYGRIRELPDAATEIHAPVAGRLMAIDTELPPLGTLVERDDLLARLLPMVDMAGSDRASLEALRDSSAARERWARSEVARLEGLVSKGAAPQRRVSEASLQLAEARAAKKAATRQLSRLASVQSAGGARAASLEVRAPHSGVLRAVNKRSGTHVTEGEVLFELVDPTRWVVELDVPEVEALSLADVRGAWAEVSGHTHPLELSAESRIQTPLVVDDVRHTVPLWWRMEAPGASVRPGLAVRAKIWTEEPTRRIAVPRSAIVWDAGVPIIYVATDPEAFERRIVRLGPRDGDLIAVLEGLQVGEQVAVEGAYLLKLAGLKDIAPDHGHAH